jgi:hypothetical protein
VWRRLLRRQLLQGPVLRRTLPQLAAPAQLRVLDVLPHLLARRQLIL